MIDLLYLHHKSRIMERTLINNYLSNFRRLVSPFLKQDVSLKSIVYPFKEGALIIVEFNYDGNGNNDFRSESADIQEALRRSNLFEDPENAKEVEGTKLFIQKNKLIALKGGKDSNWNATSAKSDVSGFIDALNKQKK